MVCCSHRRLPFPSWSKVGEIGFPRWLLPNPLGPSLCKGEERLFGHAFRKANGGRHEPTTSGSNKSSHRSSGGLFSSDSRPARADPPLGCLLHTWQPVNPHIITPRGNWHRERAGGANYSR